MRLTAMMASAAMLAACQSTPEPCTQEWVEWKSEKVLKRFALNNYSEVKRLRDFSETLEEDDIGPLIALQIPAMIEDFKELATNFETSVLPELNAAADLCGGAQELAPAFVAFLRDEGIGEDVLEWVELLTVIAIET
ncbi:MAG: hypothetical protein AAGL11_01760 [Pseudomonadota bacterium]